MSRRVNYWVESEQGHAVSDISFTVERLSELVNFRLTQSSKGKKLNKKTI